jgi:aspartyl-tRNA(Asn)/glutamyl-tRNA(Gln) amidotransferase subunit C
MTISLETIDTIAQLARLEFADEEKAKFGEQFAQIVEYFNALEAFDLEGVEPLKTILDADMNVFREDEVEQTITTADALRNAPKHNGVFFKVPKVIEQ